MQEQSQADLLRGIGRVLFVRKQAVTNSPHARLITAQQFFERQPGRTLAGGDLGQFFVTAVGIPRHEAEFVPGIKGAGTSCSERLVAAGLCRVTTARDGPQDSSLNLFWQQELQRTNCLEAELRPGGCPTLMLIHPAIGVLGVSSGACGARTDSSKIDPHQKEKPRAIDPWALLCVTEYDSLHRIAWFLDLSGFVVENIEAAAAVIAAADVALAEASPFEQ